MKFAIALLALVSGTAQAAIPAGNHIFSCHLNADVGYQSVMTFAVDKKAAEMKVTADYLTTVNDVVIPKSQADGKTPAANVMVITSVECVQKN